MPKKPKTGKTNVFLVALACGASVESAARKAGISERTAYRWLEDKALCKELNKARADMVQRATGMLTAAALEAVKTLVELQAASVQAAVRLGAARSIIEFGLKLREMTDFAERLAELEEQVE